MYYSINMETFKIILPCHNEEENINVIHKKVCEETKNLDYLFEFTFVDDGSTDDTWKKIEELSKNFKHINGISLSRNFGHQSAIQAGIEFSNDDSLIIMDADLQDNPKYIREFIKEWEKGYQVVLAKRIDRDENFFRKIIFSIFFNIQKKLTDIDIPKDVGHFSLIDKEVIKEMKKFPENFTYFNGLRTYLGFKTAYVDVIKDKRLYGNATMTYRKLFSLGLNGIFSFSSKPLNFIALLGFTISIGSLLVSVYSLFHKFRYGTTILGWTFGLSSIYFLSGIQLLSLSIIGQYIGRIFVDIKRRPSYIISKTLNT